MPYKRRQNPAVAFAALLACSCALNPRSAAGQSDPGCLPESPSAIHPLVSFAADQPKNGYPPPGPLPILPSEGETDGAAPRLSPDSGLAEAWFELAPPARGQHVSVFDERRRRLVVFGGRFASYEFRNDVWTLSLRHPPRWERVLPLGAPPSPRAGAAAVYDPARDRMLVFGGRDSTGRRNDLWELSLAGRFEWHELETLGNAPAGRSHHTATLDPENERILIFGGDLNWYSQSNELWELSLSDPPTWNPVVPGGVLPGPRASHSAVYVPDRHGILVFGGACSLCGDFPCHMCWQVNDTWFLSTTSDAGWTDLTSRIAGSPPCPVQGHIAIYDASSSRMLVFGGDALLGGDCPIRPTTVWSLSLEDSAWSIVTPGMEQPWTWVHAAGVLDPGSRQILVYGGGADVLSGWYALADTWALTLDRAPSWSRVLPRDGDPVQSGWDGHGATYDPVRDRLLLYQGRDVWSYSFRGHGGWTRLEPGGESPAPRVGHVAVYDSRRDRLIVFGGVSAHDRLTYLTDAWALPLARNPSWSRLPARGSPTGRQGASGVYDSIGDRLIVFGGGYPVRDKGQVWTLSLGADPEWTLLEPSGPVPSPRAQHSAIHDPKRHRMVVFGGGYPDVDSWRGFADTWELSLDGPPTWRPMAAGGTGPVFPHPRVLQAALYDPVGDRMVVVGGFIPGFFAKGPFRDIWALDFASERWMRLSAEGGPVPNWAAPLAIYDARRHRMVVGENDYLWALEFQVRGRRNAAALPGDEAIGGRSPDPSTASGLELRGAAPNPSSGRFHAEFTLPDFAPATLELFDLAGRRVWSEEVGDLGPGHHAIEVASSDGLASGVYIMWLRQGRHSATKRILRLK